MIKTRFAPSPTGWLHIGGVRTALFSWLFAKSQNGEFLVRIDDTDTTRSTQQYCDAIISALNSLGLNSDQDLKVTWSDFIKGAVDPNNIIDDMIYVILGNCHGEEIEHSGHAISNKDALTFDKREFVISSDKLESGKIYQLEVEHSNMETDSYRNIEIIVTYAATTFLDFKTKGDNSELLGCPVNPYAMDGGQTDRIKKPN